MTIQIIGPFSSWHGTTQHALMLARAFVHLGQNVMLVNVQSSEPITCPAQTLQDGVQYFDRSPRDLHIAELNVIVGLWDEQSIDSARYLSMLGSRMILVPTIYWPKNMLPDLANQADAFWYVSWDQASWAKGYWHLAKQIDVMPCVVDTDLFHPSTRVPTGNPWILGRHSRDVPEKFSQDIPNFVQQIGRSHNLSFRMLGASSSMTYFRDDRVILYDEGSIDPSTFLHECDVWVYSHAHYWRETACVSMLEAMSCGVPVIIDNLGGIREYMRHGDTGFLCNDTEEIIRSTDLLLRNHKLYNYMRKRAREFVEGNHSLESLVRRLRPVVDPAWIHKESGR
jgi:glycosyltransferase involved in cell wall biosynthesis